uniref:Uncharacterized protein n=1 Tax=Steinernema glaseri TaxID=37863 RepID=A0A1I8A077_9BILA
MRLSIVLVRNSRRGHVLIIGHDGHLLFKNMEEKAIEGFGFEVANCSYEIVTGANELFFATYVSDYQNQNMRSIVPGIRLMFYGLDLLRMS